MIRNILIVRFKQLIRILKEIGPFYTLVLLSFVLLLLSAQDGIDIRIDDFGNYLDELYLHLHQNPELSLQEKNTAARMSDELNKAGFTVTENFCGYEFVGVL